jgi:hypothetical protein
MPNGTTSNIDLAREKRQRVAHSEREDRRTRLLVLAIGGPLTVMALTLIVIALNIREQNRIDFQLKAAEVVMRERASVSPETSASALRSLFGDRLPDDFGTHFTGETFPRADIEGLRSQKELIELLAAHPRERAQIIDTWKRVFPNDKWIERIQ